MCPSHSSQLAISAYLSNFDWWAQIQSFQKMYQARRDATLGALAEFLPDTTWTVPDGGFYTWVKLPEGLNAHSMLPRAVTARVAYVSGTAFYANGEGSQFMRLSYCYPEPDRIREGVRRLGTVVAAERDLVNLFGTAGAKTPGHVHNPGPNLA